MIEGIPRISVLVITYNQEDVIARAMDSLVAKNDYLYEICVSDDCSKDRTWEILQEYSSKYPGLFVLNRNEPNLGIFENNEKTWTMPSGDIIYQMAGDDEAGKGWFKTVVDYIAENRIDWKNELFCIYGDYISVYPNGDSIVHHNNLVTKSNNLLKLSLRGLIGNRGCCFCRKVLAKFKKVSQGKSHIAEDAQDRQLQIFSENNYYIPYIGNIYYSAIGVSSHIDESKIKERSKIRPYAIQLFESWGVNIDTEDRMYSLECFPAYEKLLYSPSIKHFFQWFALLIKSHDSKIPFSFNRIHRLYLALIRRLPHKSPKMYE